MAKPFLRRSSRSSYAPLFTWLAWTVLGAPACSSTSSNSDGNCQAIDACHLAGQWVQEVGACSNPPAPDGTLCDDGTACTTQDTCTNGYCLGSEIFCSTTDACGYPATCNSASGCPSASAALNCNTTPLATAVRGCSASDYWADVTVGGQTFSMIIDSGSTTLAVAGSDCARCGVTPEYTPSTTATDANLTANAVYGDNSGWDGEIYQDSVSVAGAPAIPVFFAEIETQSKFFQQGACTVTAQANPYQGILGLGPATLAEFGTDAYMYQLAQQAHYPNVFGVALSTNGGNMWLGGYDPSAAATVKWTPMVADGYFAVAFSDFAIDGMSLGLAADDLSPIIVDTGTSLFFLLQNVYDTVTNKISADPTFQANFGTNFFNTGGDGITAGTNATAAELDASLPQITLSFPLTNGKAGESISVTLPPTQSYLVPTPGPNSTTLYNNGMYPSTQMLLGNSFMRALMVVFAADARQMGFALANH